MCRPHLGFTMGHGQIQNSPALLWQEHRNMLQFKKTRSRTKSCSYASFGAGGSVDPCSSPSLQAPLLQRGPFIQLHLPPQTTGFRPTIPRSMSQGAIPSCKAIAVLLEVPSGNTWELCPWNPGLSPVRVPLDSHRNEQPTEPLIYSFLPFQSHSFGQYYPC